MRRRWFFAIVALALTFSNAEVWAHDVPVERIVQMFVRAEVDQVVVLLRLPTSVLADANLPRLASGELDTRAIDRPLRFVAADMAANLAIQQGETTLPEPAATALVSPGSDTSFATFATALAHIRTARMPLDQLIDATQAFIDLELRYPVQTGDRRLSARLNTFRAQGPPIRTVAHYLLPSGDTRTFSIVGPPERVVFDPDSTEVFRRFVSRGLQGLLGGGEHLLLLFCLAVPVRRAGSAVRLFAAVAIGQTLAIVTSALGFSLTPDAVIMLAMVAASAVVIAALQNIVSAQQRWVWPLALVFGVLNGCTFGSSLANAAAFAGAHGAMGVIVFLLVFELGQFWIGALLWSARTWLDEYGMPARVPTIVLSALVAHAAVNRAVEHARALEQAGSAVLDHALVLLTLGWACAILLVGVIEALAGRRAGQPERASLSGTAGGR